MAKFLPLLVSAVFALGLALTCEATVYTVGDSAGWDISADLPSWAIGKTFYVGDALLFQYSSYHTLNEVDKAGYDSCSAANALLTGTDGNTTVPLATPGDRYFICGVPSHCFGGMKLQVSVQRGNATAASPSPSPQSPVAQSDYPASRPGPSTENNGLPNSSSSSGSLLGSRGTRFGSWFCGALLWAIYI